MNSRTPMRTDISIYNFSNVDLESVPVDLARESPVISDLQDTMKEKKNNY
ncbi:MAG: hypothetical protein ACXAC6_15570 [Candidatus Hodarchaeales archaeon]